MRQQRRKCLSILLLVVRVMVVNRRRCLLAIAGTAVGVAAVTILVSLGHMSQIQLGHELGRLGTNVLIIESARFPQGRSTPGSMGATLTEDDVASLQGGVEGIATIAPVMLQQGEVSSDTGAVRTDIIATSTSFLDVRGLGLSQGAPFTEPEIDSGAPDGILIGQTIVTLLFGNTDPVGNTVNVNDTLFEVIGVLEEQGLDANGEDQDEVVIIPLVTAQQYQVLGTQERLTHIYIEVTQAELVPMVKESVIRVLRAAHQLGPDEPDHFDVFDQAQLLAARTDILGSLEDLVCVLAAIMLIGGGLGITAVQLMSIRERTWEIGLHRALGARKRDIIFQFLLESTILGGLGGVLGAVSGVLAPLPIASAFSLSPVIAWPILAISLTTGIALGIASGVYPAIYASRLDPVVALRSG